MSVDNSQHNTRVTPAHDSGAPFDRGVKNAEKNYLICHLVISIGFGPRLLSNT